MYLRSQLNKTEGSNFRFVYVCAELDGLHSVTHMYVCVCVCLCFSQYTCVYKLLSSLDE